MGDRGEDGSVRAKRPHGASGVFAPPSSVSTARRLHGGPSSDRRAPGRPGDDLAVLLPRGALGRRRNDAIVRPAAIGPGTGSDTLTGSETGTGSDAVTESDTSSRLEPKRRTRSVPLSRSRAGHEHEQARTRAP